MRWQHLRLPLLGLAVYALGLLFYLPASIVLPHVLPAGNALHNPQGSVWAGNADGFLLDGLSVPLQLHWQIQPLALLRGELALELALRDSGLVAEGALTSSLWESAATIEMSQLRASIAAETPQLQWLQPIQLQGQLQLAVRSLQWRSQQQLQLQGEAQWGAAGIGIEHPIDLGDVELRLQPQGQGTRVSIDNSGGQLDLSGHLDVDAGGSYALSLQVQPRLSLSSEQSMQLALLGLSERDGGHLDYRGKL